MRGRSIGLWLLGVLALGVGADSRFSLAYGEDGIDGETVRLYYLADPEKLATALQAALKTPGSM
jgi:hypothetical protein